MLLLLDHACLSHLLRLFDLIGDAFIPLMPFACFSSWINLPQGETLLQSLSHFRNILGPSRLIHLKHSGNEIG
jgi:hypothetical protein